MKWLLTLIAGIVLGAAGLFIYLRQVPHDTMTTTVPVATTSTGPAVVAPPAAPAPNSAAAIDPALPKAPEMPANLTEIDLPVKPTPEESAAVNTLPAVNADTAAAASTATTAAPAGATAGGKLMVPVEGVKYAQLSDTFNQARGSERRHEALDIMAPKGAKVFAVADGKLVKLFNSKPGGLTIYQFDPSNTYAYYYAHLDRYADGIKEGMQLKRGELIGYVGTTGNARADAPHLHFAVVELTPAKQWWKGTSIDPYPMLAD